MLLDINLIRLDGGTQPRAAIDQTTVDRYRDALQNGAKLPAVVVFHDGTDYWLADGFHRLHAHLLRRLPQIEADVRQGTRRDAVLFSVGANDEHGLPRTKDDKRRAVTRLLEDPEWSKWADREIARRTKTTHPFVASLRSSLETVTSEPQPRTYTTKHGTVATMSVANIGKPAAVPAAVNDNLPPTPVRAMRTAEPTVIGNATLYLGDCRDILPMLGPVSHILTDPPYEEQAHKAQIRTHADIKSGERSRLSFDPITEDLRGFVTSEAKRLASGWFLAFCQFEAIGRWQEQILATGAAYRSVGIWVKPDSSPQFNGNKPAVNSEPFVLGWCGEGDSKWNGRGKRGTYTCNVNTNRHGGHQTEKPVPLLRELLLDFTEPGDTILDPFMGIGSLGVACLETGRKYVGIELDKTYFDIAVQRIAGMPMHGRPVAANDNRPVEDFDPAKLAFLQKG